MTVNERRAEIMRILVARRRETMSKLAVELGVTDRTIRSDVTILATEFPLVTVLGRGGCVKVENWYHPHKHILSGNQQAVLMQLLDKADGEQETVLWEIITEFGSPIIKKNLKTVRAKQENNSNGKSCNICIHE